MKKEHKYELAIYHGTLGEWQRIKKVNSIKEAKEYLKDKRCHSAELFTMGKRDKSGKYTKGSSKVIRKFKCPRRIRPWLR